MSKYQDKTAEERRKYLYALVLAVYRVTDRIPKEEALRLRMREEALNILAHAEHIYSGAEPERYQKFISSLQTLTHYCEVAQHQEWVDKINFAVLKHELFKFRNWVEVPADIAPMGEKTDDERQMTDDKEILRSAQNDSMLDSRPRSESRTSFSGNDNKERDGNNPHLSHPERSEGSQNDARAEEPHIYRQHPEHFDHINRQLHEETLSNNSPAPASYNDSSRVTNLNNFETHSASAKNKQNTKQKSAARAQKQKPKKKGGLTQRQRIILAHLRDNEAAQAADLSSVLSDVSSRTIRRDLDYLVKLNLVNKVGKTNGAKYKFNEA